MKNNLVAVITLLFAANLLQAQTVDLDNFYRPGTVWATVNYDYQNFRTPKIIVLPRRYSISGDSVIAGQNVHLVDFQSQTQSAMIGAIRVSGQRVYFRNLSPDTIYVRMYYNQPSNPNPATKLAPGPEYLLYDYDIHVGDTLHWKPGGQRVVKIDSVLTNGGYLRRFHFTDTGTNGFSTDHWLEGPGSSLGFFGSLDGPGPSVQAEGTEGYTFSAIYCGATHHYAYYTSGLAKDVYDTTNCKLMPLTVSPGGTASGGVRVFPNPGSGDAIHIESAGGMTAILIHDLQGRIVAHYRPEAGATAVTIGAGLVPGVYMIKVMLPNRPAAVQRYLKL